MKVKMYEFKNVSKYAVTIGGETIKPSSKISFPEALYKKFLSDITCYMNSGKLEMSIKDVNATKDTPVEKPAKEVDEVVAKPTKEVDEVVAKPVEKPVAKPVEKPVAKPRSKRNKRK